MRSLKDLTGQRFGRLTVLRETDRVSPRHRAWLCRCDCGNETRVRQDHLGKKIQACGCLRIERVIAATSTHGMTGSREHESWFAMKARCSNPRNPNYPDYGGRGITVCPEWKDSFEAFLRDMGPRPARTSLDRIDNDGNYEPGNCRWATPGQQARNRRDTGYGRWNPKPRATQ